MKTVRKKVRKVTPQQKVQTTKRWLLNIFVYFLMFLNGMMIMMSFLAIMYKGQIATPTPTLHSNEIYATAIAIALFNIFFLLHILRHDRWAFWGFCVSTLASIGLNIYIGAPVGKALLGLGAPIILFGLLYMGGRKSAWHTMSAKK